MSGHTVQNFQKMGCRKKEQSVDFGEKSVMHIESEHEQSIRLLKLGFLSMLLYIEHVYEVL
jgi:hypothetical protein